MPFSGTLRANKLNQISEESILVETAVMTEVSLMFNPFKSSAKQNK